MADQFGEFIAEGEELLDSLCRNLSHLESSLSSSLPPKHDVVNEIFRDMHTLKGISAVMGVVRIASLSHALETLLDRIRMGGPPLTQTVLEILFDGIEILRRLFEKVNVPASGGSLEVDDEGVDPLLGRIGQHVGGETPDSPKPLKESQLEIWGVDPAILKLLTEYEAHRLGENIHAGIGICRVRSRLFLQNLDTELLDLQERLSRVGEVIAALPMTGISPDSIIEFGLIVAASREVLDLVPGVEIETMVPESRESRGPESPVSQGEDLPQAFLGIVPETGTQEVTVHSPASSARSLSQTVRVDIGELDRLLHVIGEMILTQGQLTKIAGELRRQGGAGGITRETYKAASELSRNLGILREGMINVRMVPVAHVFDRLVRAVKRLSRETRKEIDVVVSGGETRMDKAMMEQIVDPLMHLVRNAVDHGIEPPEVRLRAGKDRRGVITLTAEQKGNNVVIGVDDDGGGLDLERIRSLGMERGWIEPGAPGEEKDLLKLIFQPGFSTRNEADNISGRGVGLDVVARNVARLRGLIDVRSLPGEGTRFWVTLPLTLLIIKALIVSVEGRTYAIPINSVNESLLIATRQIRTIGGRESIHLRDQTLPLIHLKEVFRLSPAVRVPEAERDLFFEDSADGEKVYVVVVGVAEKRMGLVVDSVLEQQEVAIKSLGEGLGKIPGIAGATELGNHKTILVLDIGDLIEETRDSRGQNYVECADH